MVSIRAYVLFLSIFLVRSELQQEKNKESVVAINKCCEPDEVLYDGRCTSYEKTKVSPWKPVFYSHDKGNINVPYRFKIGSPDCGSTQQWEIYHYENSSDVLKLLPDGKLRHYLHRIIPGEELSQDFEDINGKTQLYHDYESGLYCMEKMIRDNFICEYALVCAPKHNTEWTSTEFLMKNIINPLSHGISMICFLIIAIIYFIMPTLKDLVGNIITTISISLIVSQAADMTRLLTVFTSHVSIIIAETVCYFGLLGAFFWLNSLAYYIWKTFRSRNVYLRVTDGKKYCYYSAYAWSSTIILGFLAIFAHYTMDYPQTKVFKFDQEQENIGSLGMIIFFVPIAFTVLINIFFFATTLKIINRMNTYGRIHHKLRHSFRMFFLLFVTMTITWVFFLMSFSKYDSLIYSYIIVNALQGPTLLYICLFDQKHVSYLIRKTCCYVNCICPCCRPDPECEWGDEMTAMNTDIY